MSRYGDKCPEERYESILGRTQDIMDDMYQYCNGPCSHYNPCQGGGRCIPTGKAPEEFFCHCERGRIGKYCEFGTLITQKFIFSNVVEFSPEHLNARNYLSGNLLFGPLAKKKKFKVSIFKSIHKYIYLIIFRLGSFC